MLYGDGKHRRFEFGWLIELMYPLTLALSHVGEREFRRNRG
jgi:hypothetical protein